jgi:flagellar hook-associated protein 3 FlgL
MGGTLNNIYNNVSMALHLHTDAMTRLQEQASTGSKINRVSDDASAGYQVLGLDSQQSSLKNYIDNLSDAVSTLEFSSTIFQDIISAVAETKVRLTQVSSGIYSEKNRERTAEGINEILEQLASLVNTKHNGQYLFGGGNTSSVPYLIERVNGEITRITYQGSYTNREIEVAPGLESSAYHIGDEIFRSDDRGTPTFYGDTGAACGTGTSSVRGNTSLTVTGSAGNYMLSIDGGLTTFSTDGTDTNLMVTSSVTGEVLYVDTTGITSTGTDVVSVPGTYDLLNTLVSIRDILRNKNGLPGSQIKELQAVCLNSLEEMDELLIQAEVSTGSKIGFLDDLKESLTNLSYNAEDENTRLQEADIAQIAIDLSRREVLYEMSLSIAGKLMSMSLLDYII